MAFSNSANKRALAEEGVQRGYKMAISSPPPLKMPAQTVLEWHCTAISSKQAGQQASSSLRSAVLRTNANANHAPKNTTQIPENDQGTRAIQIHIMHFLIDGAVRSHLTCKPRCNVCYDTPTAHLADYQHNYCKPGHAERCCRPVHSLCSSRGYVSRRFEFRLHKKHRSAIVRDGWLCFDRRVQVMLVRPAFEDEQV